MNGLRSPVQATFFRRLGWVAVASMLGLALVGPGAGTAQATKPVDHKVTICHATDSDHNPYVQETVDIASSGMLKGGHNAHIGPIWQPGYQALHLKWGDIIPPYHYVNGILVFDYPGLNWSTAGQAIWGRGCGFETTTTTSSSSSTETTTTGTTTTGTTTTGTTTTDTSTTTTTTSSSSTTDTTTTGTTTTGTTTTTTFTPNTPTFVPTEPPFPSFPTRPPTQPPTASVEAVTSAPSPSGSGEVAGVTGKPHVTPPPTSSAGLPGAPSDGTWRLVILALASILALLLVLTPATARRR